MECQLPGKQYYIHTCSECKLYSSITYTYHCLTTASHNHTTEY